MNKIVMADAMLFLMGTLFGLSLAYIFSIVVKHIRTDKSDGLRIIEGGKDKQ